MARNTLALMCPPSLEVVAPSSKGGTGDPRRLLLSCLKLETPSNDVHGARGHKVSCIVAPSHRISKSAPVSAHAQYE
eukprot:CAMPEP_0114230240 /NCGR_PEP_ID=MMETSP0058-20121206/3359_1 /TAXON_ID=36894 /ORGANISM="Pyramimonas parkeae, CCMP726" /LENGTH=76 /DNA_ID=CAMNT_0001341417 /DNA_START=1162 /DNA_END=1392 /DNA_ORIENTATION=+